MVNAMELFDLEEGEMLVTEATSPNWTPAFARHRRVRLRRRWLAHPRRHRVSREYGIPCVVGMLRGALAGSRTGDLIEVDGTRGVITILERASS